MMMNGDGDNDDDVDDDDDDDNDDGGNDDDDDYDVDDDDDGDDDVDDDDDGDIVPLNTIAAVVIVNISHHWKSINRNPSEECFSLLFCIHRVQ